MSAYKGKIHPITTVQVYISREHPITVPVGMVSRGVKPWLPRHRGYTWLKKHGKYQKGYVNIYAGYDIETTNVITEVSKTAYMYIWQMAICSDTEGAVYIGRTWEDFEWLLKSIKEYYNLDDAHRLIMWDANLGFEFQFIRKHLSWSEEEYDFFAKEHRKPLLTTTLNIEFRECLSISGGSLAQLAKDFTTTQKLKGDLDYSIPRNSHAKLTMTELGYCINDVVILAEWSKYIFTTYIEPLKTVPVTKTGLLRGEVKREWTKTVTDKQAYRELMSLAMPNDRTYDQWFRYLFRGGYVHSNLLHTNRVLSLVDMWDITSSYPNEMLTSNGFPITPFTPERFSWEAVRTKCCIMIVEFHGLHNRGSHSIESKHKAIEIVGGRFDNGRIYHADRLTVALTELDLINYCRYYKWRKMRVLSFQTAKRGRLPLFIRSVLARHYKRKAQLKRAGLSKSPEYALVKSGVNSAYGLLVTRLQLDRVTYRDDKWELEDVAMDYNALANKQILLPQWGIYVSAMARHHLLTMVWELTKECGDIVVYCDTDSIKHLPHPKAKEVFDKHNRAKERQLRALGLGEDFEGLGGFDFEGTAERFKTLGAKRYLVEMGGKVEATIAGLPKSVIASIDDPFDEFKAEGFCLAAEQSEKLTTCYNDHYHGAMVDGEWMEEESSVALYSIPFKMVTEKDYYAMLICDPDNRRKIIGQRVMG